MDFRKIETGSVIMLSGDSTTDVGRARPYGTYRNSLGDGYPRRLHEIVSAAYPEKEIKFVNSGISGETSRQVRSRWIEDCEAVKPDYATLLIGVNDVWRHYDTWLDKDVAVDIDEYEDNMRFITEYSVKNLKEFTLIAPFYFETNKKDPFMQQIIAYSDVCKKVASELGAEFISLQPELDRLIKVRPSISFAPDRVHPNAISHTAIALYLLKKWNFKF